MLQDFLSKLRASVSNDSGRKGTRRRHPRRQTDRCVAVVGGQTFPVEDWSQGGLLISGDSRAFGVGQDVDLMLKFKLRDEIIDIGQQGRVVRKGNKGIAFEFTAPSPTARRNFQKVLDDTLAREFANSQTE